MIFPFIEWPRIESGLQYCNNSPVSFYYVNRKWPAVINGNAIQKFELKK